MKCGTRRYKICNSKRNLQVGIIKLIIAQILAQNLPLHAAALLGQCKPVTASCLNLVEAFQRPLHFVCGSPLLLLIQLLSLLDR